MRHKAEGERQGTKGQRHRGTKAQSKNMYKDRSQVSGARFQVNDKALR